MTSPRRTRPPSLPRGYLTAKDIARRMGRHRATIQYWAKFNTYGFPTATKIAGYWVWSAARFERWLWIRKMAHFRPLKKHTWIPTGSGLKTDMPQTEKSAQYRTLRRSGFPRQ